LLSPHAERLTALAAASWSYDRASHLLDELCGLRLSDTTIRRHSLETAGAMRTWQREAPEVAERFQQADGAVEFSTDGTGVNTVGGWREMRLAAFAKRPAGSSAAPAEWDNRTLPAPTARVVFGGFWTATQYGPQWRAWATRLGIRQTTDITVLADGAKWIWRQADQHLPGAAGVLDIYHSSEHLYGAAKGLFGDGAAEVEPWVAQRRQTLLTGGAAALHEELQQLSSDATPAQRRCLRGLDDYFAPHGERTPYRDRLAAGRPIGSGLIEGACKTVIGRRLKQTGARWRLRNAERVLALCGLMYGDFWDEYWKNQRS
jgi:hypothetical protein